MDEAEDDEAEGGDEQVPGLAEGEGGHGLERAERAGVVEHVLEVGVLAATPALPVQPVVQPLPGQGHGDGRSATIGAVRPWVV